MIQLSQSLDMYYHNEAEGILNHLNEQEAEINFKEEEKDNMIYILSYHFNSISI